MEDFRPRNYQVDLREIAVKKNSIIYLPTGSGKTFIAILVLKHLQQSFKRYSEGGKISFILVNTVALVDQHTKCIEKRTTLKVGKFSGDMNLDFWPKSKWYEEFDKYDVLVMTTQILLNLNNQDFIDLNQVNLIIFDECHRGVSDHSMRQLCKSFENLYEPPRVLGLTATLLNGNCKPNRVVEQVRSLEITYHSQVATVDGLASVIGYSTNPRELVINVTGHITKAVDREVKGILVELMTVLNHVKDLEAAPIAPSLHLKPLTKKDGLKKLINTLDDIIFHIDSLGTYGGNKSILSHIIQVERLKKHCEDANLYMILGTVQATLSRVRTLYERAMKGYDVAERIFRFSSDKILKLISIFDYYQEHSKEELCALVFTQRRFTAKVLFLVLDSLRQHSDKYSYLKPNFMVGYNSNPYNDTRENFFLNKKNREVLQAFENKECNALFASNVLEEGVDISTCSLVVKFDYPEEYRSYIQSKGRARNQSSLYFIMVEEEKKLKFMDRYREFQEVERALQEFLIGKNECRREPSEEEIQQMYKEDELPPYYVNGPNSAKVDMVSAISLLTSYCQSLSTDKYTDLTPEWFFETKNINDGIRLSVTLVLPTLCPLVEPIKGQFMANIKLAKRAAALKACELLHRAGELDDHLLPRKNVINEEDVSFLFRHYPAQKEPMAGTKKNKRQHRKILPDFLKGPLVPNHSVYLHILELIPLFERREELNHSTFYDIYTADLCYGLLTPGPVPDLIDFPIYVSLGTINVHLKVNTTQMVLTQGQIYEVQRFNFVIYNDILQSVREFLVFDKTLEAESLLLVPINRSSGTVNFTVMRENHQVKETWVEPTEQEKISLEVTQENYLRKIVSPWYRDMGRNPYLVIRIDFDKCAKSSFPTDTDQTVCQRKQIKRSAEDSPCSSNKTNNYLVTEVSLCKSALSPFPNEAFDSYEDYYKDKHSVSLVNPSQPLLYVKSLTKKTNFFKPVGAQAKRKKEKTYEDLEIHLIPELVVKQDFPSSLWIQANLLPTIVSRLSFVMRLEQFRIKLAEESGLGRKIAPKLPLELDEYLLNYEAHVEDQPKSCNMLVSMSNEKSLEVSLTNINVNRDYAKKMLELEYPWKDTEEPKDIERNLDVTLLDVEYYEKFIGKKLVEEDVLFRTELPRQQKLALTYHKDYIEKKIDLLENKDTAEGPQLSLLYKAMTTASANDIVNMERLETLGDSFLKLFSSIYIYQKFPSFNEGLSTSLKGRLVSNKNLYYLAAKKGIGGLMKIHDLQICDWLPPGFKIPDVIRDRIEAGETSLASLYRIEVPKEEQVSGELSHDTLAAIMQEHTDEDPSQEGLINNAAEFFKSNYVGDKFVADCVEALLGACFQTCGITGGIKFMEWMGIIPESEQLANLITKIPKNPILTKGSTLAEINRHIPNWQRIEDDILGYRFKNRAYLLQALTHASYTPNRITQSYEKLEFLGDAILDFLITCHIYESCGNLDPGDLTDLRSALVNNNTFASLVVRCDLHKYLLMINSKLQSLIDRFAQYFESKKYEIDDEVLILLEEEDAIGLKLADYIDVPKVLGDVFEALAGAVYLDSDQNLQTVWKVFHRIMWKEIDTFSANVPKNPVRRLYEWQPDAHPTFGNAKDVQQGKVMVPLSFMLSGREQRVYGFGTNKTLAKKAAAKLALRQLKPL